MKLLLPFLLLLAGCSTDSDPMHAAVSGYIKKNLGEPDSYSAVRWGEVVSFQQKEVDAENAAFERLEYHNQLNIAKTHTDSYARLVEIGTDRKVLATTKHRADVYLHRADSVSKLMAKLEASTDTTRLGKAVWHAFRAKNKTGALVLDSALFIVFNDGKIAALKE
jgi:hypothetical protein